jgi:hypothetical protein
MFDRHRTVDRLAWRIDEITTRPLPSRLPLRKQCPSRVDFCLAGDRMVGRLAIRQLVKLGLRSKMKKPLPVRNGCASLLQAGRRTVRGWHIQDTADDHRIAPRRLEDGSVTLFVG